MLPSKCVAGLFPAASRFPVLRYYYRRRFPARRSGIYQNFMGFAGCRSFRLSTLFTSYAYLKGESSAPFLTRKGQQRLPLISPGSTNASLFYRGDTQPNRVVSFRVIMHGGLGPDALRRAVCISKPFFGQLRRHVLKSRRKGGDMHGINKGCRKVGRCRLQGIS